MKKREPVSKIMTTQLHKVVLGQSSLHEAKDMLEENNIRHLPVTKGDKIVGILSHTDIMRISFGSNFGDEEQAIDASIFDMLSVEQVMKQNPVTINPSVTVREAAEILSKEEFHALPVEENGDLVGIVTTTDMLNYLLEQY